MTINDLVKDQNFRLKESRPYTEDIVIKKHYDHNGRPDGYEIRGQVFSDYQAAKEFAFKKAEEVGVEVYGWALNEEEPDMDNDAGWWKLGAIFDRQFKDLTKESL